MLICEDAPNILKRKEKEETKAPHCVTTVWELTASRFSLLLGKVEGSHLQGLLSPSPF